MKKVLCLSLLAALNFNMQAQSLEDIEKLMAIKKFADAKTAVDKYMADPKNANSADGHYYKGRVYNTVSKEESTSTANSFVYKQTAFESFQKNQQLDKKDLRMKLDSYVQYFDLYGGFYDLGAKIYNAAEKDYSSAYKAFSKAEEIENFILTKGYTLDGVKLNKLDTSLVLNIATAALLAKDTNNAVKNYRRLTDAGIVDKEKEGIYEFLVMEYFNKKDEANYAAMSAKAKAAYPKNNLWDELEIEKMTASGNMDKVFAKYEEVIAKDPTNYANRYNYSLFLYNNIYDKNKTYTEKDSVISNRLIAALIATLPYDEKMDANLLLVNHLYNVGADYSSRAALIKDAKPPKPVDVKKKKDLQAKSMDKMNELMPFADKSITFYKGLTTLTSRQKVNYKMIANYLVEIYRNKNNLPKAAEYEKLIAGIKF